MAASVCRSSASFHAILTSTAIQDVCQLTSLPVCILEALILLLREDLSEYLSVLACILEAPTLPSHQCLCQLVRESKMLAIF